MTKTVAIIGTLDTKGNEFKFIKDIIEDNGLETIVLNAGVREPVFEPDISNEDIAELGGSSLAALLEKNDRGEAVEVMMKGAREALVKLHNEGKVQGVISLGGSAGTTIGSYAMQAMPVGLPKILVSTVASGNTSPYVDVKDITMMYSVVDISGINILSSKILSNAANAISGMVSMQKNIEVEAKPLIGATMFGVTTPCVDTARKYLEEKGYEVLVFHATGTGGRAMESLIEAGFIKGVLDVTTTEWCDQLVGGVFPAGEHRSEAAGKAGIPQVVSTGAMDMVNFGAMDTVPIEYKDRNLYKHNATVTLMRTTEQENKALGEVLSSKLNMAKGKTSLFLPLKGVSLIDTEGQPFYNAKADQMLFNTLEKNIDQNVVNLVEMNTDINDEAFALAMAKQLVDYMRGEQ